MNLNEMTIDDIFAGVDELVNETEELLRKNEVEVELVTGEKVTMTKFQYSELQKMEEKVGCQLY